MKRHLKLTPIFASLVLTVCEAEMHFGEKKFYIPWYAYILFVALICLAILIPVSRVLKKGKYVCPKCGEVFSPEKFSFSLFLHDGEWHVVKCPKCAFKGFCRKSH